MDAHEDFAYRWQKGCKRNAIPIREPENSYRCSHWLAHRCTSSVWFDIVELHTVLCHSAAGSPPRRSPCGCPQQGELAAPAA
jgi:hypothetical protein